jgi:superfamily II DNA or RNA helicase
MSFTLRDYQEDAHKGIIEKFKQNLKTLLVMATGSGKSKTIVSFIAKYRKHFIFILIVKNRKLVEQLAKDTKLFNLDYGVFMASHDDFDPSKEIQVCSIDTITTRGEYPHIKGEKDLIVIIDEADQSKSPTYKSAINKYMSRKELLPDLKIGRTFLLGMTATPYNGLDHFDTFINPITPLELKKRGILVEYDYKIPKEALDYSNIKITKGDWNAKDVTAKMDTPEMIKTSFEKWLEFGQDRQTLIFCSNKKHAQNFVKYINNYYGKELAFFIFDKTPDDIREQKIKDFENGILRFLVNIRIITRGVDIPVIGCILDCAPTLNINLHIQKLGRGSRKNPFYLSCIIIDMVKNCVNNGGFYMKRPISLTSEVKRTRKDLEQVLMKVCEKCFRGTEPEKFIKKQICPFCGYRNAKEKPKPISKREKNKIFLETASEEAIEQRKMINEYKKLLWKKQNLGRRYRKDIAKVYAHMDLLEKYGIEKVLKIRKSIGLSQETIDKFRRRNEYIPLGGL